MVLVPDKECILDNEPSEIGGWLRKRLKGEGLLLVAFEEEGCVEEGSSKEEPRQAHNFTLLNTGG